METRITDELRATHDGQVAEEILRKCVHCGFCTATCPTYQLLGDELDGPRGRIYLIKQVLEGKPVTEKTRTHLDRCLTCRSCETTCPSGVKYSHLLDVGRAVVEEKLPRRLGDAVTRALLRTVLPNPALFGPLVAAARVAKPLLPSSLADKLPPAPGAGRPWPPAAAHARRMLVLAGCVQPSLAPNINGATARILDRLGIALFEEAKAGCCGALRFHLNDQAAGKDDMRRNIDAWWPHIEAGIEAIVVTASGCGVQVKDYGHVLADDAAYAQKAARISALCRDPSEILVAEKDRLLPLVQHAPGAQVKLAFHSPCTLQHGLKIRGVIEELLQAAGYALTPVADSHLCCGSAGTYSVLQPELADRLRSNKLAALNAGGPALVATANIGCLTHLQAGGGLPVRHWVEVIDEALS
ncbi:glycolate oxidase subunit GlcF [Dechloromonas sp. XY25]|uniref:Glycolate oxidase iron-sulfur subunit n=1 Tax=Dechloromonas hankyongensis TaxID=2908002 RepID=A0ABS9K6U0_9RHOO|nr:glycolate oxidase subunit GlcF [Dechloromonas hankyongensis]MCG2578895.1 glycolate oxidase subunit GlcF [Dechloromonas hankyongensis]